MYIHMYVCTYVRTYVCMYACMYACMHVCMHACMYVHTNRYIIHPHTSAGCPTETEVSPPNITSLAAMRGHEREQRGRVYLQLHICSEHIDRYIIHIHTSASGPESSGLESISSSNLVWAGTARPDLRDTYVTQRTHHDDEKDTQ